MFEEIIKLLKKKKGYFYNFYRAAIGKKRNGQRWQYKVEKWVQAEIVNHFWKKGWVALPEYNRSRWDINISRSEETPAKGLHIAIKCFAESFCQSIFEEIKKVKKDFEMIKQNTDKRCAFLLIVPWAEGGERRDRGEKYLDAMPRPEDCTDLAERMIEPYREEKIYFRIETQEGILVKYWEFRPENA